MHDELAGIEPSDRVLDSTSDVGLLAIIRGWLAAALNVFSAAVVVTAVRAAVSGSGSGTAVTSSDGFIMIHGTHTHTLF